ncbi:UNVERIFIED_CONTAM: hypothetical protein PYX00_006756 [Menopon gallinae]|uniref:LAGLIDADG homing endonuclease n=1 Tax=Menopon gallinae TaxID=328185 RepID=A0AAW2HWX5_9NEOP
MNFEDSDEDGDIHVEFCYWNNWIPKVNGNAKDTFSKSNPHRKHLINQSKLNNSHLQTSARIQNWIPPKSFGKINVKSEVKSIETKTVKSNRKEKIQNMNEDWGMRIELHEALNITEGERFWNIMKRGLFGEIKLWKNEYGNICCRASGKISGKGTSEKSLFEITTEENLRKLLGLSHLQWSALCDAVRDKDCTLNFNAFEDFDINAHSPLEKLWFFLCKRRHFLPNVCVLGKLSGAVKMMKEFRIVPKVTVLEIRDFGGEEIS